MEPSIRVYWQVPEISHPAKGVALPLDRKAAGSTAVFSSRFHTVYSSFQGMEKRFLGAMASRSTSFSRESTPFFTRYVYKSGNAVAVGGVVGGDHVDGAVQKALDEGFPVRLGAQGRVHLEAPVLLQIVFVQQQVVGGRFAGHVHPGFLRLPDDLHALLAGNVAHVVGAAFLRRQPHVPGDGPPFAFGADAPVAVGGGVGPRVDIAAPEQGIVLAMGGDELMEALGLPHGPAHHVFVLHALPVVGKSDDQGGEGFHVRQLFACLVFRDGPVGVHPDPGGGADEGQFFLYVRRGIGHGVQIGHGAHGGVPAPGGGQGAGENGFLIRKTRLAKMHVHVAKAGENGQGDVGPQRKGRKTAFVEALFKPDETKLIHGALPSGQPGTAGRSVIPENYNAQKNESQG